MAPVWSGRLAARDLVRGQKLEQDPVEGVGVLEGWAARVYLAAMVFEARLRTLESSGVIPPSTHLPMDEAENRHEPFMRAALREARAAATAGEVPVGAVVVLGGEVIGRGRNGPIAASDPTAHAEIVALRDAARNMGNYRLPGATLYATVEPCLMCAGACLHARLAEVVFGAPDEKAGAVVSHARVLDEPAWNHRVRVTGGILAPDASELMRTFFRTRRAEGYRSGRTGLDSKSSWG
jgi:tRNA(adenine34) deaminase